jgi:hypothetical protein
MPGRTIGTRLHPPTEIVWKGIIEIRKTNNEYSKEVAHMGGDATLDVHARELLKPFFLGLCEVDRSRTKG